MSWPRGLTLHHHSQNAVNARLVALAMTLEPSEHVRVETNRQLFFRREPSRRCLLEKSLVERPCAPLIAHSTMSGLYAQRRHAG